MGTTRTDYEWDGSALLAEQTGNNKILYLYDGTGLIGFKRNGVTYTYVYNGLGDVMEILDKDGNAVVSYLYDAWGAPISITGPMASTLGAQNPIRYRGYYYDTETGLYYLQSRYYDPVVGRFLNADSVMGVNGDMATYNLFAYCGNNPVNRSDPTGHSWWDDLKEGWNDFWGDVGDWFGNTFGTQTKTTTTVVEASTTMPVIVGSVSSGVKTTATVTEGESKPVTFTSNTTYSKDGKKSSSVGVNIAIGDYKGNISIGTNGLSGGGSIKVDGVTYSGQFTELGYNFNYKLSTSTTSGNVTEEAFLNVKVDKWVIAAMATCPYTLPFFMGNGGRQVVFG